MDMKLELIMVPVTDVDRAKAFYVDQCGFNADYDERVSPELRFVQLTPPGSGCSIAIGEGLSKSAPGSIDALQLVVASADEARDFFTSRGLDVGEVQDQEWGRFVYFKDPDGNKWAVQELPKRG